MGLILAKMCSKHFPAPSELTKLCYLLIQLSIATKCPSCSFHNRKICFSVPLSNFNPLTKSAFSNRDGMCSKLFQSTLSCVMISLTFHQIFRYTKSASYPKDMLILMDNSGSMKGLKKSIAVGAVKALLNLLGDDDFFNVLSVRNNYLFKH